MFHFFNSGNPQPIKQILCLGAHCDDIDIGCGGTLLALQHQFPQVEITWVVFASNPERAQEVRNSADHFLGKCVRKEVLFHSFRDGFLPQHWSEVKEAFEGLKKLPNPDLIFTHARHDAHQDHRIVNELTWNTFRNHFILEYEIPKFDGDLGQPNSFVPLSEDCVNKKIEFLQASYPTQRTKNWFDPETFRGLMRIRGMECQSPTRYAEAFYGRKIVLLGA